MLLDRLHVLLLLLLPLCCTVKTVTTDTNGTAVKCMGSAESQTCLVAGPRLVATCRPKVSALALRFKDTRTSWPADGGLNNCYSVTHLKVTGWSGPELSSGHLRQLGSLSSAVFVDGGLESVGPQISTDRLSELTLARNKITDIHERSLDECAGLVSLDLSDNFINHLASRLLTNCRSLRSLRLSGNRLAELQSDALRGAVDLREVFLQRNRVKRLSQVELAFSNNPKITLIDLRDNDLLWYSAGQLGFCGPSNVTVRMHFAGCPPVSTAVARSGGLCDRADRSGNQCVGISARLIVTFTSCQVSIGEPSTSCFPRVLPISPKRELEVGSGKAMSAAVEQYPTVSPRQSVPSQTTSREQDVQSLMLRSLGILPEGVWLLYALIITVVLMLALLTVFLCVFHRLKLKIARLQAREDPLVNGTPNLCHFHTIHSQSVGLSGRATPSGRDQSSHCGGEGASQCCGGDVAFEQPGAALEMQRMLDGCCRYSSARLPILDAEEEADRLKLADSPH